jgi:hypothetical protein
MGSLLIRPSAALQLFVEKLLIFDGEKCDIGHPMRVLPRPNVVLGFQYGELVRAAQPNGNPEFFESGLTGLQTLPRSVWTTEKKRIHSRLFHAWWRFSFPSVLYD